MNREQAPSLNKYIPGSQSPITEPLFLQEFRLKREDYEKGASIIKEQLVELTKKVEKLRKTGRQTKGGFNEYTKEEVAAVDEEESKIEVMTKDSVEEIDEENDQIIEEKIIELSKTEKDADLKKRISDLFKKARKTVGKDLRGKLIKYFFLPASLATGIASTYHSPEEYYSMWQNWSERHLDKYNVDDPNIEGISALYNDSSVNVQRSTYDYLGDQNKVEYKGGYYMVSVFDLTGDTASTGENGDRTPPRFKIINDRDNYTQMDSAAGITTTLFKKFQSYNKFVPELKGHKGMAMKEIPVIAYDYSSQTIKAGHYKDFAPHDLKSENYGVSETYEIPLNFKLDSTGKIALVYHANGMRMVPVSINEQGKKIPFPIGITYDKTITHINPREATHFGTLEGGKVIMVCGKKQLQVNGSFADMFRVYERLQKEYPHTPIQAYLLDNGSYNLPIWNKDKNNILTTKEIKQHLMRNAGGGTALVLINDGAISPYEYRNKYKEIKHHILGATLDSITQKPAVNEKQVIVIHHTGNYADPNQIVSEFSDTTKDRSAHVLILKNGTRHTFNTDNDVLAHAGKSDFNDRNKVNYFSLGIEMEGDTKGGHQFTIAQLESMLEYMRPRIEKYHIPLGNITTHKIIRNNYIKKHPAEQNVPGKNDLDDRVWTQIRDLIAKKLYINKPLKVGKLDIKAHQMIGTLAYRETYRTNKNKDQALNETRVILARFGVPSDHINKTINWITRKVV